jgi:hypothetical protein
VGANATYLHVNGATKSQIESGGTNISGYTNDFDGDIRQGNTGYSGLGTAPDMGADEFSGLSDDQSAPARILFLATIVVPRGVLLPQLLLMELS